MMPPTLRAKTTAVAQLHHRAEERVAQLHRRVAVQTLAVLAQALAAQALAQVILVRATPNTSSLP